VLDVMTGVRSQAGFTMPEILVAMTIGLATMLAVFAILDTTMKQSNATAGRVNATQRGRIAMDTITRQLRSQVCYSATVPALVEGSNDHVKFHMDLSNGSQPIEQREIAFDPTANTIRERTWAGVGTPLAFPAVTRNRLLLDEVTRATDRDGNTVQFLRYYAYNTATPPRPILELPTPLSATNRARVAQIKIAFTTLPPGTKPSPASSSTLQNEIYVRVADPNDPAPIPTCA
jgi:prepilin-type N-terminal cleavage/methylation domain-containing protein